MRLRGLYQPTMRAGLSRLGACLVVVAVLGALLAPLAAVQRMTGPLGGGAHDVCWAARPALTGAGVPRAAPRTELVRLHDECLACIVAATPWVPTPDTVTGFNVAAQRVVLGQMATPHVRQHPERLMARPRAPPISLV